jgi:riboflavin kinase / FMN adenylyltransferase
VKLLASPAALPSSVPATAITVGTFDGVHRGHQDVLARLVGRAEAAGLPSVLVTFEPHPLEVLNPSAAPALLTTRDEKLAALEITGLDYVALLAFDAALASLPAEEFVDRILLRTFRMRSLLIGHDHGFGRGREGSVETLRALGSSRGFDVEVVAPVQGPDGRPVSSSIIRRAVAAGDLDAAAAALGRAYSVRGPVVPGEGRGRSLGYRTLNVAPPSPRKLLPPDGVYAVEVATAKGRFGGMLNLGARPTFDDARRTIEAHLFEASGDFYGDVVELAFVRRLRDTRRFDGPEALMAQLADDERAARRALTAVAGAGNLNGSTPVPPSTP